MGKYKGNFVKAPSSADPEEEDAGQVSEDSMIENGTSESDSEQESESDDGFSDQENVLNKPVKELKRKLPAASENAASKRPKDETNHYKPPTVAEINQLRETENLFHSNLFRLQIQEMLNELKVKEKYKNFIKTWVNGLNNFLDSLESMPEKESSDSLKWLRKAGVQIPIYLDEISSNPFWFQFIKSTKKAFIIGSTCTDTIIGPTLMVDICILIPAKVFQKDDYLNLMYDQKRALYLTYIASKMIKNKFSFSELKFNYYRNNPYKPVIEIFPEGGNMSKKLQFRIFTSGEIGCFKLSRFVPWNSNIRGILFGESSNNSENEVVYATPFYNATVLFDVTMQENQKLIEATFSRHRNLQEGLILLKIWMKQRNLDCGLSGFGAHIMTMFLVYLIKQKKIHLTMSSYQIARNVWNQLAISAWHEESKGITLYDGSEMNRPTMEQFHANYDVVFVDSTGFLNICAHLSLDVYLKIKFEAERAVELLNNKSVNSFQVLFMVKIPIFIQFDHVLKLCNQDNIRDLLERHGQKADKHNFIGLWYPQLLKMICSVLRKGLGQRILSMVPVETVTVPWSITERPSHPQPNFLLGFVLNPENAYNILDKGPQANESTAQEFRDFWGDQAQLRRFQDGSITEACVWSRISDTLSQKRLIVRKIVLHLLNHHFKLEEDSVRYIAHQFDAAYELNERFHSLVDGQNDAEDTAIKVIHTFDSISKNCRALEDLPLDIHSIQGISSIFRYCDPVPTLPKARTCSKKNKILFQSNKVLEGVIQLGVSGKWPTDLPAFRRVKTAFHIQIAKSLRDQLNIEARGSKDGVHILKDGYLFKLEICHQKEIALLKKIVSVKGVTDYKDTPQSLEMEKRLLILPKMTSVLHGLYQQYSSFGPAVMIAKRWLYSQMLDNFLWPDECTELLIASLYMKVGPLPNAFQPQTGFFRFLHLLAKTDWTTELFLLNFNEEMSQEEITEIENAFTTERDSFPSLSIVTSYDTKKNGIWGQRAPSIQVLARVTLLARHTLQLLESAIISNQQINITDLFVPSLKGYDVIIYLKKEMLYTSLSHQFKIYKETSRFRSTLPLAGYDPVQRGLQELRDAYSDFAVFFYNPCGGREIAVLWKPEIFEEKEFKVGSINGCKVMENGQLKCNILQILEDFKIVLRDLYLSIKNQNKSIDIS